MFITLPDAVLHAIQMLNRAGHEAFAVGGCVRDCLMGNTPQDWDITTSATPWEMQTIFASQRTIETGLQHGTLTVVFENVPLEITTYRIDGHYSDGRHPDKVIFTRTLTEDLRRRDFTINAMAYHPHHGLIDPFDGQADIQHRKIRCVGVPIERFTEDALRILRALRFSSVLGFSIDHETATALHQLAPALHKVSAERIASELQKLLCGAYAARVCEEYALVLNVILPELSVCDDFRLLGVVNPVLRTRLAALFYGANLSADAAKTILRRLKMNNQTIHEVSRILTSQSKAVYTEDSYILHLLHQLGPELIFDYLSVREADANTVQRAQQLLHANTCYCLSMLAINGDDVVAAGTIPGPAVGTVLNGLLCAVIDGLCANEKEALLNYIPKIKKPVQ